MESEKLLIRPHVLGVLGLLAAMVAREDPVLSAILKALSVDPAGRPLTDDVAAPPPYPETP